MEKFNINGQIVKVNVQKTKGLYDELPIISDKVHCGCSDCVYYTKAITHISPTIQQFFQKFGVDPRKEAEVWRAFENNNGTYYYVADYHFIGEIQDVDELEWIDVDGASFGLTNYTGGLPSPMIPKTFTPPIIEMVVRINLLGDF